MTEINFQFSKETRKRMTWEDLETIEMLQEGESSPRRLRPLMARCMVDSNLVFLPHKQAMKILGGLVEDDIQAVMVKFSKAITDAALPKAKGNSSEPLSEATPASEFPTGSAQ